MKIIKANEKKMSETPHGINVRKLLEYEHASVVLIELKKGEGLKPHITPVDVFFYVLEGKGEVMIGEEKEIVEKDDVIFSPKDIVHGLTNPAFEIFKFLVVKTPTPTSPTKLMK